MALLDVKDLSISFRQYSSFFRQHDVKVMDGLSLTVHAGEIVALVGASGSGKSLLAHAIMGILPANARMEGTLLYENQPLHAERVASLRGKEIAFVPQSVTYLDPLMRVGAQVRGGGRSASISTREKQRSIFKRLRLEDRTERLYPHQLSGGMARRVLVAAATAAEARLIIADEPTPGMHPEDLQAALSGFRELADTGVGLLFITHDIQSALTIADRVAVIYAGTTVEIAPAADFTGRGERLRHPYTRALWRALPMNGLEPLRGMQPTASRSVSGCAFAPRCEWASPECTEKQPPLKVVGSGHTRCIHEI